MMRSLFETKNISNHYRTLVHPEASGRTSLRYNCGEKGHKQSELARAELKPAVETVLDAALRSNNDRLIVGFICLCQIVLFIMLSTQTY